MINLPKPSKDIHPRVPEFSERDYDTGWIFSEVRAYAWQTTPGFMLKHAINGEVSVCGIFGPFRSPENREERITWFSMPRCMDCLKLIGAPTDHPYRWELPPPPPPRRKKAHKPFVDDRPDLTKPVLTERQRRRANQIDRRKG